jgi:cystathionine gamma-lyase
MSVPESNDLFIDTLAIHGGQSPEPITGAVMPPVFQTSTYAQPQVGEHTGYEYSRTQNPTREALERCLASLEGAKHGFSFGSGCAATAGIQHLLSVGDKVVCGDDVYGGTWRMFTKIFSRHGIDYTFVDFTSVSPEQAIPEGTKMVWLESPTNPLLKVADIRALAKRGHEVGAMVVVDNTFATPIFQRPLELGADLVIHSTTKYLNGHSDVVGGAVMTNDDDLAEQLAFVRNGVGNVSGPWDCWLTLRGLKTLAIRMDRHQSNAVKIVDWLNGRPEVSRVFYPMDSNHPQHELAKSQMSGFGGMISFEMNADLESAKRFCAATKIFCLAESLGGVESLLELPAAMTHASIPPDVREEIGIADGLVRLSVGIENVDDLIADLESAFAIALS